MYVILFNGPTPKHIANGIFKRLCQYTIITQIRGGGIPHDHKDAATIWLSTCCLLATTTDQEVRLFHPSLRFVEGKGIEVHIPQANTRHLTRSSLSVFNPVPNLPHRCIGKQGDVKVYVQAFCAFSIGHSNTELQIINSMTNLHRIPQYQLQNEYKSLVWITV